MDRQWFFTWRTYGTWLPGADAFVGFYRTKDGTRQIDNRVGEAATPGMPALASYARDLLVQPPVLLTPEHAGVVLLELLRTCEYRGWQPVALAVLPDHVHVVFGVPGDPEPECLLREIKAYSTRALNRTVPKPQRWWVTGGSTRAVKGEESLRAVVCYINDQDSPLVLWLSADCPRLLS
jgi:hypothetical protein